MPIQTNIMTKLSGSALSSAVGGRIYSGYAPQDAEYPNVVFSVDEGPPDYNFTCHYEDRNVQFSLYSISEGLTEITGMYTNLKTLFDDCVITLTGETSMWMVRTNKAEMVTDITTVLGISTLRHWAVDYNLYSRVS